MVNNINKLQEKLKNELVKNWKETDEEVKEEVSISLVAAEYRKKNIDLLLRIKDLEKEKNELKKTLLAELVGGVHDTYKNFIAEKESKIKELEKRISKNNSLIISIYRENNEFKKKLEEKELIIEKLESKVEELDDEVWMEREEAEKALNTAMKWRKNQMAEVVLKHDAAMDKLEDRIDWLENNLLAKNQEIDWRNYLENKELPALPKQQKRLKKLKQLVSKVKERTKEKFQAFIVQKNK